MKKFMPDMYQKSILDISYNKLKEKGIKLLLFDLDNTLIEKERKNPDEKIINKLNELKKDFKVLIVSNTIKKPKIMEFYNACKIDYIMFSRKPLKFGFKKVKKLNLAKASETIMIGDQILTDILGAKRMGYFSALIDPIGTDDVSVTKINRKIENYILKKLKEKYSFEKGKYYE